jgi:hypothetical protein
MAPILGIWASSKAVATDTGAMFPLQVITVGPAGASTISFTNIPNTYSHLQLRIATINSTYGRLYFNNDTTAANYRSHFLSGNGSAASAGTYANVIYSPWDGSSSNDPYVEIIDILDYANTNKNKVIRQLGGMDKNGSGQLGLLSGLWLSTSAINEIDLVVNSGNFAQYSQFALYAVKGA